MNMPERRTSDSTDDAMPVAPRPDVAGIVASLGVIAVAVLVLHASRAFSPLGAVFPRAVAVLMLVLGALYVVLALRRRNHRPVPDHGSNGRRLAMFAVMLAWALLIEPLGFLTTSLLCYGVALLIANYDRWTPRSALLYFGSGASLLVALYLLFRLVLNVPLPPGVLI